MYAMYILLSGFAAASAAVCLVLYAIQRLRWKKRGLADFKRSESSDFDGKGTRWSSCQHEYRVERFYETGLTGRHDFHGGYLNFGYWVNGNNTDYIKASHAMLSEVADTVFLNEDSELLDVANGMGAQDIYYYEKYKPKHIDMIDVTLSHHLMCKKRVEEHGLQDRLAAHYGSATELPFAENSFTHVFCIEGGVHFKTRQKFFKEAYRVLKPNGYLSIADFLIVLVPKKFSIQYAFGWLCSKLWNAPIENFVKCEELKKQMESIGFVDVVVKDIGKFCIPGYYNESMRPETLAQLSKIRGWFNTYVGGRVIDELILYVHKKNILTEVIVAGRKPHSH